MDKVYWCNDCHAFVDIMHRCQQWATVYTIPKEALDGRDEEIATLKAEIERIRKSVGAVNDELGIYLSHLKATENPAATNVSNAISRIKKALTKQEE